MLLTEEQARQIRTEILLKLYSGVCLLYFMKKDGSMRSMYATLKKELVPETKSLRPKNFYTITVFDINKLQWRSFDFRNLKHITHVNN